MPEGDTVHLTAARLHGALAGRTLVSTDFRVPRFANADLSGQRVREVIARGKHLLLRTDAAVTLHSHLKMEGAWDLYRPGQRWRGPAFQVRVVLVTEPWTAVGSQLGICELTPIGRSARPCSTSGRSPVRATSGRARSASCVGSAPGRRSARSATSRRCSGC